MDAEYFLYPFYIRILNRFSIFHWKQMSHWSRCFPTTENSNTRATHSPAIIYYTVLDLQRGLDPYRLLTYMHTSEFCKKREKERKRERERDRERERERETNVKWKDQARQTKHEMKKRNRDKGRVKIPKKRKRSRVGVLLPADLSYWPTLARIEGERARNIENGRGEGDT